MRKFLRLIPLLFIVMVHATAFAQQQDELQLRLSRDFGYSSGTGKIQGAFTMKVSGPENLARVVFYLDDQVLGEVAAPPYKLRFTTDSYSLGMHTLSAIGFTDDGRELRSNKIQAQFVSAEEGWQAGVKMVGPVFGVVFGMMILSFVFIFLTARGQKSIPLGAQRRYGVAGGTICPRCQRPFALHLFAPNLVMGKFERCPFCGKWAVMRPKPMAELRAAEAAEIASAQPAAVGVELSQAERFQKELDDSRYQSL